MSKTKYCVTVVRTGCVFIEAASPEEAMDIADHQRIGDISWSDDWSPTDAEVDDGYLGEYITERAFNRKPQTNREAFFDFMRSELERKVKVWEEMTDDEFLDWASRDKSRIEFLVGRELCGFKLTSTNATSVGNTEDFKIWLKEEARDED